MEWSGQELAEESVHPSVFVRDEEMMINCTLIRVNSNVSARYGDIKFN